MNVRTPLSAFVLLLLITTCRMSEEPFVHPEGAPNFIVIITDDQRFDAMGVAQGQSGRISRFPWLTLPTIDSLAATGTYFKNSFVTTSLCSPSRASILTGQYARTHRIRDNYAHFNMNSFASELQAAGYYTGYFGKWHMGEQDGPRPGFDHSYSFIGQGEYFDADFQLNGRNQTSTGWVDEVSTDHMLDKLEELPQQPFCFVMGMKSAHGPWNVAPEITADYFVGDSLIQVPNTSNLPFSVEASNMASEISPSIVRQYFVYFRYLAAVDKQVEKILASLKRNGYSDNTYLVFMSDNGFFMGEHRIRIDKRLAYEESIRIPFFINGPEAKAQINEAMVLNIDVCPTLLQLAGLPNRLATEGRSLVPLMHGEESDWRTHFLYEYYKEGVGIQSDIFAVRDERYKLIRYRDQPEWDELFDLQSDPYETTNLILDEEYSDILEELDRKLN